jgi:DNA polymerase-3 subunit epsilon
MTGGQVSLTLATEEVTTQASTQSLTQMQAKTQGPLKVIKANDDELAAHEATLERLNKVSGGACVWLQQSDT